MRSTGFRHKASVVAARGLSSCSVWLWDEGSKVVAHRLCCSMACGIFLDQGSNPCPLPWQADSYPLYQQGSPEDYLDKALPMKWQHHRAKPKLRK